MKQNIIGYYFIFEYQTTFFFFFWKMEGIKNKKKNIPFKNTFLPIFNLSTLFFF